MDTWYYLPLGDGLTSSAPSDEIRAAFQPLCASAGSPGDMAVFTRFDTEGRLQCDVTAYFSPAAGPLAELFHAQPCPRPLRRGLGLLAGDERAWSLLFPESPS